MWAGVNTKPLQGTKFQVMRVQMMGIDVEYDNDAEHRRTHPLLMPKMEPIPLSWDDTEVLKKVKNSSAWSKFQEGNKAGSEWVDSGQAKASTETKECVGM